MAVKLNLFTFCSFCVLKQIIERFFQNFEQRNISEPNFVPSDVGPADDVAFFYPDPAKRLKSL